MVLPRIGYTWPSSGHNSGITSAIGLSLPFVSSAISRSQPGPHTGGGHCTVDWRLFLSFSFQSAKTLPWSTGPGPMPGPHNTRDHWTLTLPFLLYLSAVLQLSPLQSARTTTHFQWPWNAVYRKDSSFPQLSQPQPCQDYWTTHPWWPRNVSKTHPAIWESFF